MHGMPFCTESGIVTAFRYHACDLTISMNMTPPIHVCNLEIYKLVQNHNKNVGEKKRGGRVVTDAVMTFRWGP